MNNPKVSVIIPVYNAEKYLKQCLDSIINQTLREIEIICINDGSTDSSLELLQNFQKKDSRIIVLTQTNSGAAVARNKGLAIAKGDYISILDADDFFDSNMLNAAYNRITETNSDVVIFKVQLYDNSTGEYTKCTWALRENLIPNKKIFSSNDIKDHIFQFSNGWAWDKLFRHEYLKRNNLCFQNTKIFNDAKFVFLALAYANKISIIHEVYATKRRSLKNSISSTRTKNWKEFAKVIDELEKELYRNNCFEKFKQSFLNYALHLANFVYRTIEPNVSNEIYCFLKNEYFPRYKFNSYDRLYYYNQEEYQFLNMLYNNVKKINNENRILEKVINEAIPLVFATDNNYARYTATCIDSIMRNSPKDQNYQFYILTSPNIKTETKKIFSTIESFYKNCKIIVKEIQYDFSKAHISIKHITTPTYYRLLLPEILYDVDKCIYLDGDTIVKDSLVELYTIDIKDNFIAGVEAYGYYRDVTHHKKRLNLPEFGPYINAGVLVMNLKEMRNNDCVNKFISLLDYKFSSQDQDILNVACYGKIFVLPYKYNVMTAHIHLSKEFLNKYISDVELEEARKKPVIIHYATKEKPWDNLEIPMSKEWWRTALEGTTWYLYASEKSDFILKYLYKKDTMIANYEQSNRIKFLENEIKNIHNSMAYKLWRTLTYIHRKFRGMIKCYHEHGLKFTFKRILVHLRLKNDVPKNINCQKIHSKETQYEYFKNLPSEQYANELKLWFEKVTGNKLNLDNPKTFNEKIQWLKLYDSTPLKTKLADKYLVREWVEEKIGSEYLIPLLGVWNEFDEIDFNKLPNSFVLKANHGCGWNIIVKDKSKFNIEEARKKFNNWMKLNFAFRVGLELQYMNIKPKIIAEKYLENGNEDLYDYKVFCFNGKAESIMFLSERKHGLKMAFYDLNWKKLPFVYSYPINKMNIPKPKNLDLLIKLSEKLAEGFAHVRVDFYILNDGSLKFEEMTFTSASGTCKWQPAEQNKIYGDLIKLPSKSPIPKNLRK